jgi:hypothetical protein
MLSKPKQSFSNQQASVKHWLSGQRSLATRHHCAYIQRDKNVDLSRLILFRSPFRPRLSGQEHEIY